MQALTDAEERAVAAQELRQLAADAAPFEARIRESAESLAALGAASQRLDVAREDHAAAARRCKEVGELLEKTVDGLAQLRRAAPSGQPLEEQVAALTQTFVLRLPFPRPGEWIRGRVPVHTTSTTDEGVEVRSVSELVAEADPTQAQRITRVYYGEGQASSEAKHREALRVVRELRRPLDSGRHPEADGDAVFYGEDEGGEDGEARGKVYVRAAQVTREVVRMPAPVSLGAELDAELRRYLVKFLPALGRLDVESGRAEPGSTTPATSTPATPLADARAGGGVEDGGLTRAQVEKMIERGVRRAMEQRLDAWAESFHRLQRALGTTRVPYSSTWVELKEKSVAKLKTRVEKLDARRMDLGVGASPIAAEDLQEPEGLERDLHVALSHAHAHAREAAAALETAGEAVTLAQLPAKRLMEVGDASKSWVGALQGRAAAVVKLYRVWRELSGRLRAGKAEPASGVGGKGQLEGLERREADAREELRKGQAAMDEVVVLAEWWSGLVEKVEEWVAEAVSDELRGMDLVRLAWSLRQFSSSVDAVAKADVLWRDMNMTGRVTVLVSQCPRHWLDDDLRAACAHVEDAKPADDRPDLRRAKIVSACIIPASLAGAHMGEGTGVGFVSFDRPPPPSTPSVIPQQPHGLTPAEAARKVVQDLNDTEIKGMRLKAQIKSTALEAVCLVALGCCPADTRPVTAPGLADPRQMGGWRQQGGWGALERLKQLLVDLQRPHFGEWVTPELLQDSASAVGVVHLSEEESAQLIYRLGGEGAALDMYNEVFRASVENEADSGRARERNGETSERGVDQTPAGGAGPARERGDVFDWHGRVLRAESNGGARDDDVADRLVDDASDEVLWDRSGCYCRRSDLLECADLMQLIALTANLSLPLGLLYPTSAPSVIAKTVPNADANAEFDARDHDAEGAPESGAGRGREFAGVLQQDGSRGARDDDGENAEIPEMMAGEAGLMAVGRLLLRCGWGRDGGGMPTYDDMRRYGARRAAAAIRLVHGGLRRAASALWLMREAIGLSDDFVLTPLPFMVTDELTDQVVWIKGEDPEALHDILAHSWMVRARGRAGVVVTEDRERLRLHYHPDGFESLDSVVAVCEILWEDLEVVDEGCLPMYCELECWGFKACADAILHAHGGLHELADMLNKSGPWQHSRESRKQRRLQASAASSAKLQTRNWMLVLRAVKQVADESAQPQDMPTYQALDKEGLGHLTLALRGRTTIQLRPARRELLPPPNSGRVWAAQDLGLNPYPRPEDSAACGARGAAGEERYVVAKDRAAMLERYADVRVLRAEVEACALAILKRGGSGGVGSGAESGDAGDENGSPQRFIPSYTEMIECGFTGLAEGVRARKGGMLSLLDLWDGPRMVLPEAANHVRHERRLFRPDASGHAAPPVLGAERRGKGGDDEGSDGEEELEEAIGCGLLEVGRGADSWQGERGRRQVRPPSPDSSSDSGPEALGNECAGWGQRARGRREDGHADESMERLELPYVHKEIDLGPLVGSERVDGSTGGWRLAWNFEVPWMLDRAVQDLSYELCVFDRVPSYQEMRQHGWGPLADFILQSRHRSDCPRAGRAAGESSWVQESCYCIQLLLCDAKRQAAAERSLSLARERALAAPPTPLAGMDDASLGKGLDDGAVSAAAAAAADVQRALAKLAGIAEIDTELRRLNPDFATHELAVRAGAGGAQQQATIETLSGLVKELEVEPAGVGSTAGDINVHKFLHHVKWSETWRAALRAANISVRSVLFRLQVLPDDPGATSRCFSRPAAAGRSAGVGDEYFEEFVDGSITRVSRDRFLQWRMTKGGGGPLSINASVSKDALLTALVSTCAPRGDWWQDQITGKRLAGGGRQDASSRSGFGANDPEVERSEAAAVRALAPERRGMLLVQQRCKPISSSLFLRELFDRVDTRRCGAVDADDVYVGLHQLGVGVTRFEARCMVQAATKSHEGRLTWRQFEYMLRHSRVAPQLFGRMLSGAAAAPSSLAVGRINRWVDDELGLDVWGSAINRLVQMQQRGIGLNKASCLAQILRQKTEQETLLVPLKVLVPRLLLAPPPQLSHNRDSLGLNGAGRPPWDGRLVCMFVMDGSAAVGEAAWSSSQRLVQDVLRRFSLQDEGRVCSGFVQFASQLVVDQPPSAYLDSVMHNLRTHDVREASALRRRGRQGDAAASVAFRQQVSSGHNSGIPRATSTLDESVFHRTQSVSMREQQLSVAGALQRARRLLMYLQASASSERLVCPAARHVLVLVVSAHTLQSNGSEPGLQLAGLRADMESIGVELMILADTSSCASPAEVESHRALATRPHSTHFFLLPSPHLTHPAVAETAWDRLLRRVEERVDESARPRSLESLIHLTQHGAKDVARDLRLLSRAIDIRFRDDRLLVVPLIESGVSVVAQELGLLMPTNNFEYIERKREQTTAATAERDAGKEGDVEAGGAGSGCVETTEEKKGTSEEAEENVRAQVDRIGMRVVRDRAALAEARDCALLPPDADADDWHSTFRAEDEEIDDLLHPQCLRWYEAPLGASAEGETLGGGKASHHLRLNARDSMDDAVVTAAERGKENDDARAAAADARAASAVGMAPDTASERGLRARSRAGRGDAGSGARGSSVRVLAHHPPSASAQPIRFTRASAAPRPASARKTAPAPAGASARVRCVASGLSWRNVGVRRPCDRPELRHGALAAALQHKHEFTPGEWAAFGISGLRSDHCILSAGYWFQPAGGSAAEGHVPFKETGAHTSTKGVVLGGSAAFAPPKVGLGTRRRAVPRSDSNGLPEAMGARSCGGELVAGSNAADKAFMISLREATYVAPQPLSLPAVLEVLHAMAGRPNAKRMLECGYHPDDIEGVRLLPLEEQLRGAGLQHVCAAITTQLRGWDVVMRASDPHGMRRWTPHQVARLLDGLRTRIDAAAVSRYRRRVLSRAVSGARLLDMSPAHLAQELEVDDAVHRAVIYKKVELMRCLSRWDESLHGNIVWPRDLNLLRSEGRHFRH